MPSKIKAVLFDLDGVLVDAREWHYEALNQALRLFGYEISRADHDGYFNGLPTKKKLQKLSEDHGLSPALHDFLFEMKQRYTVDWIRSHCRPEFAKQIMLKTLKKRGLQLAVCSNAIRPSIELMLSNSMIRDYFDLLFGNEDVAQNKPHPEIYLKAMDALGVSPEECLIVEDSPHGIEAATASGGRVITVRGAHEVNLNLFDPYL